MSSQYTETAYICLHVNVFWMHLHVSSERALSVVQYNLFNKNNYKFLTPIAGIYTYTGCQSNT